MAAQQLPVPNLLVYDDLKRAILQRVGLNPEQHRQHFRSLDLGRSFVVAQQLRDTCRKWLLAGGSDVYQIIDHVVLEQFIAWLPTTTAQWVQYHRPASLDLAIQLVEDQMVACRGVGKALPSVSLFLSPPPCTSKPWGSQTRSSLIKARRLYHVQYANFMNYWALSRSAPASITHKRTGWWNDLIAR
uniref:SCAN box domain-containing protein n=1 Tax=Cyprinus carpio carpio TaxID=630221 RepID=A0A9J8DM17_CYPCA